MKVIIAGTRTITDYGLVERAITESGFDVTAVISGKARGVDQLGEVWAWKHGISVIPCPADWSKYGRAAGPMRNGEMAKIADALIAIWDGNSPGTLDMIQRAQRRGLKVYIKRPEPKRGKATK